MGGSGSERDGGPAWRTPPIAKVYEAFTAVADGRVRLTGDGRAEVDSSARDKTYTVRWDQAFAAVSSTDNASRWQGYAGYPIVAVLIATGRIRVDEVATEELAGVPWNELNRRFHRDYDAAVDAVLTAAETRGADTTRIAAEAARVLREVEQLGLRRPGRR